MLTHIYNIQDHNLDFASSILSLFKNDEEEAPPFDGENDVKNRKKRKRKANTWAISPTGSDVTREKVARKEKSLAIICERYVLRFIF